MKINSSFGKHILKSKSFVSACLVTVVLAFCELCAAPGGVTQHGGAAGADNDSVRVREDGGDPVAAGALGERDTNDMR